MEGPKSLTGHVAESLEPMRSCRRLQEEGWRVQIDAPGKPKLHGVVHDSEPGYDTYIEKPGYGRDADLCFAERNRHS